VDIDQRRQFMSSPKSLALFFQQGRHRVFDVAVFEPPAFR
jgi:hypothetical protein